VGRVIENPSLQLLLASGKKFKHYEFTDFLNRLEISIRESKGPVIAAGDFNSKSGYWNSPMEDDRGALLIDSIPSLDMSPCNQSDQPTFVRGFSETFIDITFATTSFISRSSNWRILGEESLSFHKYITFDVLGTPNKITRPHPVGRWSWRNLDETNLQVFIKNTTIKHTDEVRLGAEVT